MTSKKLAFCLFPATSFSSFADIERSSSRPLPTLSLLSLVPPSLEMSSQGSRSLFHKTSFLPANNLVHLLITQTLHSRVSQIQTNRSALPSPELTHDEQHLVWGSIAPLQKTLALSHIITPTAWFPSRLSPKTQFPLLSNSTGSHLLPLLSSTTLRTLRH